MNTTVGRPLGSTHLELLDRSLHQLAADAGHVLGPVAHQRIDRPWGGQHVVLAGPRDGPLVVLVHGWPQHWFAWRHVIVGLVAAGARVAVPDTRDFGWSRSDGRTPPSIAELAQDIVAVVDHLDQGPAVLAAHDWGGWIGFEAALGHPERFRGYVGLAIVAPWLSWIPMLRHLGGWAYVFPMAAAGSRIARSRRAVRILLDKSAEGRLWARPANQLALSSYLDRISAPQSAAMTQHLYRTLVARELPLALGPRGRQLTVPTTMLVGEHESIARPDLYEGRSAPGELRVEPAFAGVRHWLAEEAPDRVVAHLVGLLGG